MPGQARETPDGNIETHEDMENKTIPVLLLTGYLGSRKTTLVNNILSNRKGIITAAYSGIQT